MNLSSYHDLNQTLYLSLTLVCFEMHPLSAAGKNMIPSFDKAICGPQQATFFGNTVLLSLNTVNSQRFERLYSLSASNTSSLMIEENLIQQLSHMLLEKEVQRRWVTSRSEDSCCGSQSIKLSCPMKPSQRLHGHTAEIYPPNTGWKPQAVSCCSGWNQ